MIVTLYPRGFEWFHKSNVVAGMSTISAEQHDNTLVKLNHIFLIPSNLLTATNTVDSES